MSEHNKVISFLVVLRLVLVKPTAIGQSGCDLDQQYLFSNLHIPKSAKERRPNNHGTTYI